MDWGVSRSQARWPARRDEQGYFNQCVLCQSITGALACAPSFGAGFAAASAVSVDHRRAGLRADSRRGGKNAYSRVSRSQARWPARREEMNFVEVNDKVSVDHRRAGLRAAQAFAPTRAATLVSVDHRRAGLRALWLVKQVKTLRYVSVDHRRAGLRAVREI